MKLSLIILSGFILSQASAASNQLQKDYLTCVGYEKKITNDLSSGFKKIAETIPAQEKTDPKNLKKFESIYYKHLNAKSFEPYFLESLTKMIPETELKKELEKCKKGTVSEATYDKVWKDVNAKMKVEATEQKPNPYMKMFQELSAQIQQ